MAKAWLLLIAGLSLAACQRGCHRAKAGSSGPLVEPGVSSDGQGQPRVSFEIETVYEHQQPTEREPWHAPGGEWTFFDAHTDSGTSFSFGWTQRASKESTVFGHALWSVSDANEGADLVRIFARAFDGKVPPPTRQESLHPQQFARVSFGDALGRADRGGFSGSGNWHASKLFLQRPGIEAELFLNFDLLDKRGEFAEKDAEYANDLLLFMARELRDGPPPPQTPENDARISLVGPKLAELRPFGPEGATFRAFEAQGARVIYSVKDGLGTRVFSVNSEGPPDEQELMRLERDFTGMSCAAAGDPCVVEETLRKDPSSFSSSDPSDVLLLERAKKRTLPLVGPWASQGCATKASISPDAKFIAVAGKYVKSKPPGMFRRLHFASVDAPTTIVTYARGEDWLDVVGWQGSGANLRAVVQAGLPYDKEHPPSWFLLDPKSGLADDKAQVSEGFSDQALSPDGKHRYSCSKDEEIVISDVASGSSRSFPVVPRERHALAEGCDLSWRGARFLEFSPERTAFIDIDSLKLSFPFEEGASYGPLNYDPSFTWVVTSKDARLASARISVR